MKEGVGLFFCQAKQNQDIILVGYDFKPFFSAFVDIGNLYRHDNVFNGIGVEFQYAQRGGKFSKHLMRSPAYLSLIYYDFRPCFVYHSKDLGVTRLGIDVSFLHKATYSDPAYDEAFDVDTWVAKRNFGVWIETGSTIGKHFTISFFADWLFWGFDNEDTDLLIDGFWGGDSTDDHCLTMGISIGLIFDPIKIKKNMY